MGRTRELKRLSRAFLGLPMSRAAGGVLRWGRWRRPHRAARQPIAPRYTLRRARGGGSSLDDASVTATAMQGAVLAGAQEGAALQPSPLFLQSKESSLFKKIIVQDEFGDHVDEVRQWKAWQIGAPLEL